MRIGDLIGDHGHHKVRFYDVPCGGDVYPSMGKRLYWRLCDLADWFKRRLGKSQIKEDV